jgi:hypothetical protein
MSFTKQFCDTCCHEKLSNFCCDCLVKNFRGKEIGVPTNYLPRGNSKSKLELTEYIINNELTLSDKDKEGILKILWGQLS